MEREIEREGRRGRGKKREGERGEEERERGEKERETEIQGTCMCLMSGSRTKAKAGSNLTPGL